MIKLKESQYFGLRPPVVAGRWSWLSSSCKQDLHLSPLSRIVFVHCKITWPPKRVSSTHYALATELCDWNHTREVAIVLEILKATALRRGIFITPASPDATPSHQWPTISAVKYGRRAYVHSVAVSTAKVHFEAQMEMQEWRVVILGRQKEGCY